MKTLKNKVENQYPFAAFLIPAGIVIIHVIFLF